MGKKKKADLPTISNEGNNTLKHNLVYHLTSKARRTVIQPNWEPENDFWCTKDGVSNEKQTAQGENSQ